MRVLGIDPGLEGALAFLDFEGDLVELEDMPVMGKDVNAHMLGRLIQGYGPIHTAVVERAQSMPKQGISGAFNYGVGYGKILGVLAVLEVPIVDMPSSWKRKAHLSTDKNLSRKRATQRWPTWADWFRRVKDDGRAEAALMADHWISEHPQRRRVIRRLVPE